MENPHPESTEKMTKKERGLNKFLQNSRKTTLLGNPQNGGGDWTFGGEEGPRLLGETSNWQPGDMEKGSS